ARASPNKRVRPLTSIVTNASACRSYRGEKVSASTASNEASGGGGWRTQAKKESGIRDLGFDGLAGLGVLDMGLPDPGQCDGGLRMRASARSDDPRTNMGIGKQGLRIREQGLGISAFLLEAAGAQQYRQPGGAACHRFRTDEQAHRLTAFDYPLQPQPRCERQPPDRIGRRFSDVEHHDAKVAGLQNERERPERLFEPTLVRVAAQPGVRDDMTADPQQLFEIKAGCLSRHDVEPIQGVDERDELTPRCGRREQPEHQARPSRRTRANQFRDLTSWKPSAQ